MGEPKEVDLDLDQEPEVQPKTVGVRPKGRRGSHEGSTDAPKGKSKLFGNPFKNPEDTPISPKAATDALYDLHRLEALLLRAEVDLEREDFERAGQAYFRVADELIPHLRLIVHAVPVATLVVEEVDLQRRILSAPRKPWPWERPHPHPGWQPEVMSGDGYRTVEDLDRETRRTTTRQGQVVIGGGMAAT